MICHVYSITLAEKVWKYTNQMRNAINRSLSSKLNNYFSIVPKSEAV
jgi:hypothetical protein